MTARRQAAPTYRPDIDGLRAIAVLAVIFFHVDRDLLPGGFVGVDVFLVISGYLITLYIAAETESGRFSLLEFYRRRVKRIAPALMLVIAVTLLAAQWLYIPEDTEETAKAAAAGLLSVANVYFWLFEDDDYFAESETESPLLHLWSLGVEEQYYLVWPLIMGLMYKKFSFRSSLVVLAGLTIASYALGDLVFDRYPSFAYYMLPTRMGELLLGGMCALVYVRGLTPKINATQRSALGLFGLLLIGVSLFMLSDEVAFPGVRALPPTLGTAFVIIAGQGADGMANCLLRVKPLVFLGLLSYSAYLWHWPVLTFWRYGFNGIDGTSGALLVLFTLGLAWATYTFVEQPARRSKRGLAGLLVRQVAAPAGAIAAVSIALVLTDGVGVRSMSSEFQDMRPAYEFPYVCQRYEVTVEMARAERCVLGDDENVEESPTVLLWGDSHAAHYVGVLGAFAKVSGFRFRNIAHSACPPLLKNAEDFVGADNKEACRTSVAVVREIMPRYGTVVIAAAWASYDKSGGRFMERLRFTVEALREEGKRVVLFGQVPYFSEFDRRCTQKAKIYPFLECDYSGKTRSKSIPIVNDQLRVLAERWAGVYFYSIEDYLCDRSKCSPFTDGGRSIYFDSGHLAIEGSWGLGRRIVSIDGVPGMFLGY